MRKQASKAIRADSFIDSAGAIHIRLPTPPRELHPNSRTHWAKKARLTRQARLLACATGKRSKPPKPWIAAEYTLTVYGRRKRDYDGLLSWCKAYLDGFQDAGIVANDAEMNPTKIDRAIGEDEVVFVIWEQKVTA